MGQKFTLVQALRGLAALWVVLFHAAEGKHLERLRTALPPWLFDAVFEAGHHGVSIFFALSGFVIAHSLRDAVATPRFAGRFVLRRAIRLDPPYWATIALVIGQQMVEARIKSTALPEVTADQLLAHLFYLQAVLGYPQISAVFWTLCYEIQFYLGFMLLLMIEHAGGHRARILVRSAMFALALAGALQLFESVPRGIALGMWQAFFVGVAGYWAGRGSAVWTAALAILAVTMIAGRSAGDMISAGTAMLLFAALRYGRITTTLAAAPLQWLGTISYSLYLSHNLVAGSGYWIIGKFMPRGVLSEAVQLVLVTAGSLVFAYALWWLVERPAHDYAKWIGAKRIGAKRI